MRGYGTTNTNGIRIHTRIGSTIRTGQIKITIDPDVQALPLQAVESIRSMYMLKMTFGMERITLETTPSLTSVNSGSIRLPRLSHRLQHLCPLRPMRQAS